MREIDRGARTGLYREPVIFVVLGVAVMILYAAMAAWMTVVARREPARIFQIGRHGRTKRRDVTAAEWIRRYVPWGFGGGLLTTVIGLFVVSRPH